MTVREMAGKVAWEVVNGGDVRGDRDGQGDDGAVTGEAVEKAAGSAAS